jgi:hypothetical protein
LVRKAIAATLASVILFTALVAADATVMTAEDNLASTAQTSHIESRELVLSEYSAGAASLLALAQVQSYLSSNPADCAGLNQYLEGISAATSTSGVAGGIAYSSNATAAFAPAVALSQGQPSDNLTIVAPFSGYLAGALNLQVALNAKVVGGGGTVSLERHELHLLHLPISPDSAHSLCASALGGLAAALSGTSCNATSARAAFDSALPPLVEEAAARGFFLAAGWQPGGAGCSSSYWIMLVELGVEGVTGGFDWSVRGSGATA